MRRLGRVEPEQRIGNAGKWLRFRRSVGCRQQDRDILDAEIAELERRAMAVFEMAAPDDADDQRIVEGPAHAQAGNGKSNFAGKPSPAGKPKKKKFYASKPKGK